MKSSPASNTYASDSICGVDVSPFTPAMFADLQRAGNALVRDDGDYTAGDIAAFLWRLSACYDPNSAEAERHFLQKVRHVDAIDAVEGIRRHVAQVHPQGGQPS